jgi:hypothetical protein
VLVHVAVELLLFGKGVVAGAADEGPPDDMHDVGTELTGVQRCVWQLPLLFHPVLPTQVCLKLTELRVDPWAPGAQVDALRAVHHQVALQLEGLGELFPTVVAVPGGVLAVFVHGDGLEQGLAVGPRVWGWAGGCLGRA